MAEPFHDHDLALKPVDDPPVVSDVRMKDFNGRGGGDVIALRAVNGADGADADRFPEAERRGGGDELQASGVGFRQGHGCASER